MPAISRHELDDRRPQRVVADHRDRAQRAVDDEGEHERERHAARHAAGDEREGERDRRVDEVVEQRREAVLERLADRHRLAVRGRDRREDRRGDDRDGRPSRRSRRRARRRAWRAAGARGPGSALSARRIVFWPYSTPIIHAPRTIAPTVVASPTPSWTGIMSSPLPGPGERGDERRERDADDRRDERPARCRQGEQLAQFGGHEIVSSCGSAASSWSVVSERKTCSRSAPSVRSSET